MKKVISGMTQTTFIALTAIAIVTLVDSTKWWYVDHTALWEWHVHLCGILDSAIAWVLVFIFGINPWLQKNQNIQEVRREFGLVKDLWDSNSNQFVILYGGDLGSFVDDEEHGASGPTTSGVATIYSIERLEQTLKKLGYQVEKHNWDKRQNVVQNKNVVILGGYLSIPALKDLPDRLRLRYRQDFEEFQKWKTGPNRPPVPPDRRIVDNDKTYQDLKTSPAQHAPGASPVPDYRRDYAIVTRIPHGDRLIWWLSGNTGIGTYASVLFFTMRERMETRLAGFDSKDNRSRQWVIEVSNIQHNSIDLDHPHIDKVKDWAEHRIEVDSGVVQAALYK